MLPDFVRLKKRTERQLLHWLEQQIPELTPLMKGIQRFRQHEGRLGRIVRADNSEGVLDYPLAEFSLEITRDDIRSGDIERIKAKAPHARTASPTMPLYSASAICCSGVGGTAGAADDARC